MHHNFPISYDDSVVSLINNINILGLNKNNFFSFGLKISRIKVVIRAVSRKVKYSVRSAIIITLVMQECYPQLHGVLLSHLGISKFFNVFDKTISSKG